MTCIAGLVEGSEVWIGGDSFTESCGVVLPRCLPKLFRLPVPESPDGLSLLMGSAGDTRFGHVLRYRLQVPPFLPDGDPHRYLCCEFADAVRDCLRNAGMLRNDSGIEENESTLMIGFQSRLFVMGGDFNASETIRPFRAIGSGQEVALGAMFATPHVDSEQRILLALEAASEVTATVIRPFHVEKL